MKMLYAETNLVRRLAAGAFVAAATLSLMGCYFDDSSSDSTAASFGAASAPPAQLSHPKGSLSLVVGAIGGCGNLDGSGSSARFNQPQGVARDAAGNLYVADTGSSAVRKISSAGIVTTLAGPNSGGSSASGSISTVSLDSPEGIAVTADGQTIYVLGEQGDPSRDGQSGTIWRISGGAVTTLFSGSVNKIRYGGSPVLVGDDLYFLSDQGISVIRAISTMTSGTALPIVPLTGPGASSSALATIKFSDPQSFTIDSSGALLVGDADTSKGGTIYRIDVNGVKKALALTSDKPHSLTTDSVGNVYFEVSSSVNKISSNGSLTLVAGSSNSLRSADGVGAAAGLDYGASMSSDASGNLAIAQYHDCTVRTIDTSGNVRTIAGLAAPQGASVDGPLANAVLQNTYGLKVDRNGAVFFGQNDGRISKLDLFTGEVSTFSTFFSKTNDKISAIDFDSLGVLYASAAYGSVIYRFNASAVDTGANAVLFAGLPSATGNQDGSTLTATFESISSISFDSNNSAFIGDSGNRNIRVASNSMVTTLAGGDGGASLDGIGTAAGFFGPLDIVGDSNNLYVADGFAVRSVSKQTGAVTTLAGGTARGSADGVGSAAGFGFVTKLVLDGFGNLYVADTFNSLVRKVVISTGEVSTVAGHQGKTGISLGDASTMSLGPITGLGIAADGSLFIGQQNSILRYVP